MILRANLGQALAVAGIAHVASGLFFDRARGATSRRLSKRDEDDNEVLQIPLRNFGNQQYTVHIQMAKPAVWFNFTLANTHGYTAVAGIGCESCSEDPNEGLYNAATSSTYISPLVGAQNITFKVNGKTCTGQKASENCAFKQQTDNGTKWWEYDDQHIIVASTGSSTGVFGTSAGLAGLGYSSVQNGTDSIIGKYLSAEPDEDFTFAISLFGVGSTAAPNGAQLAGDSSGGYMHLNGADSSFYSGSIETFPVAGSDTTVNFGTAPDQVGSYDWTVRMQGWLLKTSNSQGEVTVTGGQGMYATMEAGYPYILLPQADASKIYAAIAGAQTYIVPSGATTDAGVPVYDDALALSWAVPCTTTNVAMYMNFNGTSIPIQPSDLWTSIGGVCVGNIKGWADPTRTTAIMGSTFFRNAYVVFTASSDSTQNTVGIAARPSAAKTHSNTKVIVGAVVGGVGFVALCIFGFLFFLRWKKNRRGLAPSAAFAHSNGGIDQTTMGSRTMTALSLDREKSPGPTGSSFFGSMLSHGKGSYGVDGQSYVAEPWVPPPSTTSPGPGGQQVSVQPWTPTEASEQAFLSPTGTAAELPYQQTPSPRPNTGPNSPRPHSAAAYGVGTGSVGHQRPMSQVSWVSGTTQMAPQSAVSGHYAVPSPTGQMPMQMQSPTNSIMQVHPPGAHVPTVRPLPSVPGAGNRTSGVM